MLPNFLLIGAMKCGTTSLADHLAGHPQIFMSVPKELHFFSWPDRWQRGLKWYESFFTAAAGYPRVGEASTTYTMHPTYPEVPARIADILPAARFLYLVRHPIDRVVSHYMHLWYLGATDAELEDLLAAGDELTAPSRYYYQLSQYLAFFPSERFQILVFEELTRDPVGVCRQAFRFLEVDPDYRPGDLSARNITAAKVRLYSWAQAVRRLPLVRPVFHALVPTRLRERVKQLCGQRRPPPPISPELREHLAAKFEEDVAALSDFAHRDFARLWQLGSKVRG